MSIGAVAPAKLMRVLRLMLIGWFYPLPLLGSSSGGSPPHFATTHQSEMPRVIVAGIASMRM
jgi:hypothetical protein